MFKSFRLGAALGCGVLIGIAAMPATAGTVVTVPGSSDPFLAGQPSGASCCSGDSTPAQAAVFATAVSGGQTLTFTNTSGGASYTGGTPSNGADGDNDGTNYTSRYNMAADYGTGISGALNVNLDGLVGVFLTDATPSGAAPAQLDFAGTGGSTGLDFASLSPSLYQIFWIGDGLTGIGSGQVQTFIVPTGATRLFLGTVDGYGWYNNSGSISVTINGATRSAGAVPEPASWAMMIGGFGMVGGALRRRRMTLQAA